MTSTTEPRRAGEGQDGQRDGQRDGQGPGQPPGTPRAGHVGTGAQRTRLEWGWIWGAPVSAPLPPALPQCLYLFCDSFFTWGSHWGFTLKRGGTDPLPSQHPQSQLCSPTPAPHSPQWGGGHLDTLGRSGPGSGGCESPLPWGFGVSAPLWGCPPSLPQAGTHRSGWLRKGGSHWRGPFPLRGQGSILSPPGLFSCACSQLVGVLRAWWCPHKGVTGGCMLHPWGWVWGWGELLCPSLCQIVWGGGTPTCQGRPGGSWEWSKTWGGKPSPASAQGSPLLVSPGQLCVPSTRAWDLLLQSGGQWGPPHSSAFAQGGRDQRPAVRAGGDRSLWLDPGHPLPRDPLPPHSCSPWQGLCWGQAWLRCPPPLLSDPPSGRVSPGWSRVCPPAPVPWLVSRRDSHIMVLSTLDSLLFSNCC